MYLLGREVAEYCTRHMEGFIKDSKSYKDASDIHKALEEAFLNCDRALLEEDAQKELKEIIQESLKEEEGDCTLDDLERYRENCSIHHMKKCEVVCTCTLASWCVDIHDYIYMHMICL